MPGLAVRKRLEGAGQHALKWSCLPPPPNGRCSCGSPLDGCVKCRPHGAHKDQGQHSQHHNPPARPAPLLPVPDPAVRRRRGAGGRRNAWLRYGFLWGLGTGLQGPKRPSEDGVTVAEAEGHKVRGRRSGRSRLPLNGLCCAAIMASACSVADTEGLAAKGQEPGRPPPSTRRTLMRMAPSSRFFSSFLAGRGLVHLLQLVLDELGQLAGHRAAPPRPRAARHPPAPARRPAAPAAPQPRIGAWALATARCRGRSCVWGGAEGG